MKRFKVIFMMLFLSIFFTGCEEDSPLSLMFSPPECDIYILQKTNASIDEFAKIEMEAENTTDATAFNVAGSIEMKVGDRIIERSSIFFGTLEGGESTVDEAWLPRIKNHNEYEYIEIILSWNDAEGDYYEKKYY